MNIKKFLTYWKEVIFISVLCITLFIFAERDYENPFYPDQLKTGVQVMADKWPHPDFNNPNFLADFHKYMGFQFEPNEPTPNKINSKNLIWWPLHIKK